MLDNTEKNLIIKCPHCNEYIIIEELNCRIFRHGIMKNTRIQMDSHSSKEVCDNLVKNDSIYGCGKPFMINENLDVIICDYI